MTSPQKRRPVAAFGVWIIILLVPYFSVAEEVKSLQGHQEAVAAVAYSPDGQFLATGSFDKTIKLWDAKTLKEIKTFSGHTDLVLTLAFSPDGSRLISGSQDNTVKVWSLPSEKEVRSLPAAGGPVRTLAVSADGKLLACAADDGVVRLYEAATGKLLHELKGHAGPVYAAAFSADGASLYSCGADRFVNVWSTKDRNTQGKWEVGTQPATTIEVVGQAVVTGNSMGIIQRWNLPAPVSRNASIPAEVAKLTSNAAGTQLYFIGPEKVLQIYDPAKGAPVKAIDTPAAIVDYAISSTDPQRAATVHADGVVRVWNATSGQVEGQQGGWEAPPTSVAFTPDGKNLLIGAADGGIRLVAYPFTPDVAVRAQAAQAQKITAFASTHDGGKLVTASVDTTIHLFDGKGTPIRAFALFAPVRTVAISGDGNVLAAAGTNNELRVWQANGAELKKLTDVTGPVALSSNGKLIAFAKADNKVYLAPADASAEPKAVSTHAAPVKALAFSTKGDMLFAGGDDKAVKVIDVAKGAEAKVLGEHPQAVVSLTASTDGKYVASGTGNLVIVWDVAAGKEAYRVQSPAAVVSTSFSSDGQQLAVSCADNRVRIFANAQLRADYETPAPVGATFIGAEVVTASADANLRFLSAAKPAVLGKHGGKVTALAISADGKTLLSASEDKTAKVWNLQERKEVRSLAHGGAVTALALSSDASKLVTGSADKTCRVWNLADGKQLLSLPATQPVIDVAYSDAGRILFASADNIARVHNAQGVEIQSYTVTGLTGVAFGNNGKSVILGSKSKELRISDVAEGWIQNQAGPIQAIAGIPNGSRVLVAGGDNSVTIRDASNGNVVKQVQIPTPTALAAAKDNARVIVGSADKMLRLIDINNGNVLQQYPATSGAIAGVAISVDGKTVASTAEDGTISLWSVTDGKTPGALIQTFHRPGPATAVAFLPDNKTIAAASADKVVRYFELPPPAMVNLAGHKAQVYTVTFSPDGKMAASGSADKTIILWDLQTAKAAKTLTGHDEQVYDVAFSKDGKSLASAGGDKKAIVWDLAAGKAAKTLEGATDALYRIAWIEEDKKVIAGGVDKFLHVWDVQSGKEERKLQGQPDEIYGLALSPDGKTLVTSGYGGNLLVWNIAEGKPVQQEKLNFGAFDVDYSPVGGTVAVANNDAKTYVISVSTQQQK